MRDVNTEFTDRLVPEPGAAGSFRVLTGLIGRGSDASRTRFYLSPDLSSYAEVADGDIEHLSQDPGRPVGAAWLRDGADVELVGTRQTVEDFFAGIAGLGDLTRPSFAPGGGNVASPITTTTYGGCSWLTCSSVGG